MLRLCGFDLDLLVETVSPDEIGRAFAPLGTPLETDGSSRWLTTIRPILRGCAPRCPSERCERLQRVAPRRLLRFGTV